MVEICLSKHRILVKRWTPERVKYVGSANLGAASLKLVALLFFFALSVIAKTTFAQTATYAVKQVSAGGIHTCLLTTTGGVKCWGFNFYGELGDGTTIDRATPTDVVGLTSGVAAISASTNAHTCALTTAGGVKCWGLGNQGQLGGGSATVKASNPLPTDVLGLTSGVVAIAASDGNTCALTTSGGVKCWGDGVFGTNGDGSTLARNTPVDVVGLSSGVAAIAVGGLNACALTTAGGMKCWGYNATGQLGDGTNTNRNTAVDVAGLTSGVIAISVNFDRSCALLSGKGVKCWGTNTNGGVGDNTTTNRNTPTDVLGLSSGVAALGGGSLHNCILTTSGGAKCWGSNSDGQIGDGTIVAQRNAPVDVSGLSIGVAGISGGFKHNCALMTNGAVKCWGYNLKGQLGDGSTTNRNTPVDVVGISTITVTPPTTTTQPQVFGSLNLDGGASRALVVRSPSGQLQAGRFNGSQFVFSTLTDPGINYRIVGAVALNNGGKSDLVFQDITQGEFGDVLVWRGFNPATQFKLRQVKRVWDVQAVGDLDGDGFGDLVWRYTVSASPDTGVSYIWFTDGTIVTKVRKRGGAPLDWSLLGAADLNADGAADMVYVSPANQIRVLMGTANRTCANLSGGAVPAGFTVLKFGDFTGGGRGDVLIRNTATGEVRLLSLNASGLTLPPYTGTPDDQNASCTASSLVVSNLSTTITPSAANPLAVAAQFYTVGDFNGDGIVDIAWVNADGSITVWLMQANGAAPVVKINAGAAPFFTPITNPPPPPPPPVAGGTCVGLVLTTGTTYDNRGTVTQTIGGAAIGTSEYRSIVIGPGTYKGQSVIIVEGRAIANGQLIANASYNRTYYDDRGATLGVIGIDQFNPDGSIGSTTTYSPVDYQPKTYAVGANYSGRSRATAVAITGGFTTTVIADYTYTGSITGTETVTVPAGIFSNACVATSTVQLVTTFNIPGLGDVATTCDATAKGWLSPIGPVKGQVVQASCVGNTVGAFVQAPSTSISELIAYSIK